MTTYGTIPTSSSAAPVDFEYISRAKHRLSAGLGTRRPWKEMFDRHSFAFPKTTSDAIQRVKSNLAYFQMNYALVVLLIIFSSLLWHPFSLIVFLIMMVAWVFLYFLRDEPLTAFNRTVSDRTVLIVLGVLTILALLLTHATWNILVSLGVGVVVVLVHAAARNMEYLAVDEEARGLPPSS